VVGGRACAVRHLAAHFGPCARQSRRRMLPAQLASGMVRGMSALLNWLSGLFGPTTARHEGTKYILINSADERLIRTPAKSDLESVGVGSKLADFLLDDSPETAKVKAGWARQKPEWKHDFWIPEDATAVVGFWSLDGDVTGAWRRANSRIEFVSMDHDDFPHVVATTDFEFIVRMFVELWDEPRKQAALAKHLDLELLVETYQAVAEELDDSDSDEVVELVVKRANAKVNASLLLTSP